MQRHVVLVVGLVAALACGKHEPEQQNTPAPQLAQTSPTITAETETPRVVANDVPSKVVSAIKLAASESHPNDFRTQAYVVKTQIEAFRTLRTFSATEIPAETLAAVRAAAAESHPNDFRTQLYVTRTQVKAYHELQVLTAAGVPDDVLKQIRADADASHPNDFSTQLFVVKEQVKAYLSLR